MVFYVKDETWNFKMDENNNILCSKKLNFNWQEDRDNFCSVVGAPLGMFKEEFNKYFNENRLDIIKVNEETELYGKLVEEYGK